jgi:hypothetical protein
MAGVAHAGDAGWVVDGVPVVEAEARIEVARSAATNAAAEMVAAGTAGMVTNGGAAMLGAVTVTNLLIGGNPARTNAGPELVFCVSGFTQDVTLVNSDTGAVPKQVYGLDLGRIGSVARDTGGGWDEGTASFVVGPGLAGRDLQVSFETLYQGTAPEVTSGYARKRTITFPAVAGTLTNFPALVKFEAGEYVGLENAQGGDLRFVDEAGAELSYEVEAWNTGGTSVAWVRVPLLTNGAAIRAYWGKAGASAPPYTADGSTWDTNYVAVWHMNDALAAGQTGGTVRDGSARRNNGVQYGNGLTAGLVGGGQVFGNSHILVADSDSLDPARLTLEAWFRTSVGGDEKRIFQKYDDVSGYELHLGHQDLGTGGKLKSVLGAPASRIGSTGDVNDGNWHFGVATYDGASHVLYVDGGQQAGSAYGGSLNNNGGDLIIGKRPELDAYGAWAGEMDELRISRVARAPEWIAATFMTVASNGVWQTYGPVEVCDGDWPGIFVDGEPAGAGPYATEALAHAAMTAWVMAPTNGTRIVFGARLKGCGDSMLFSTAQGAAGPGRAHPVSIVAY